MYANKQAINELSSAGQVLIVLIYLTVSGIECVIFFDVLSHCTNPIFYKHSLVSEVISLNQ